MKRRLLALCVALTLILAMPASGLSEAQPPMSEALQPASEPVELPPEELELELSPTGETGQPGDGAAAGLLVMAAEDEAGPLEEAAADAEAGPDPAAVAAAPSLTLNALSLTLGVQETFTLEGTVDNPDGDADYTLKFKSSNAKVVKVSSEGVVTGKKKGSAKITVTAGGLQAVCRVKVAARPTSISLNAKTVKLGYARKGRQGSSFALKVTLPKGSASHITYSGYNPAILEVSEDGLLTAKGKGKTKVTAATYNGMKASVTVKVLNAPGQLTLSADALELFPGDKATLTVKLPKGTAGSVEFESSDPAVARVDPETGVVAGVSRGSAEISAISFNGRVAICAVKVGYAPKKISLAAKKATIGLGEALKLDAQPLRKNDEPAGGLLKYTSGKPSVASVDAEGTVTGLKVGKAKIVVAASNGVKAACVVTVKAAPTSARLSAKKPKLVYDVEADKGTGTTLSLALSKGSASHARIYSGYDDEVVKVSAKGKVTAVGVGETDITVTAYNGLSARCRVRVLAKGERPTLVIAHRGGAGDWPENSLEAFRHAASSGADDVELDVRSCADGAQVVHHDATFSARGRKHTVEKLSLAQIQELDDDICSLDEALQVIAGSGLGLQLEMKDSADPDACVEAVSRHGMDGRVCYIAFDARKLARVRALRPEARVGLLINKTPADLEDVVAALRPTALCQKAMYLTRDNLLAWQNRGLRVGVWTVNEEESLRMLLDMGVDYVTTDQPAMAAGLLMD